MLGLEIGKNYFVRSVTDHWVGRLKEVLPHAVVLEDAAWIANSGRLSTFVANGRAPNMEIEAVNTVIVQWLAIMPWPHELFRTSV